MRNQVLDTPLKTGLIASIGFLLAISILGSAPNGFSSGPAIDKPGQSLLAHNYGKLPLSFEANEGQAKGAAKFLSRGNGYSLFLAPQEAVLSFKSGSAVRLKSIGANPLSRVTGLDQLPGRSNYFIGSDPRKWRTNLPNFAKVKIENAYPGIRPCLLWQPEAVGIRLDCQSRRPSRRDPICGRERENSDRRSPWQPAAG
jgi:hypothetical protein